MDARSRSASPLDSARPQHRPPSPPSPPSRPSAFDNRAYQPDDTDPNHNTKKETTEAVNLELINLTPRNGKVKKDVDLENATNPYDEYFVPVNEHRKYMRGEKLYVTADKRLEKGGCRRPLCWTLVGLLVAAVVALVVLTASGVLFSNTPTPIEHYNGSVSAARAFGGLNQAHDHSDGHNHNHTADHDHDHNHDHIHDHNHDHVNSPDHNGGDFVDHNNNDGHDHNDGQIQENNHNQENALTTTSKPVAKETDDVNAWLSEEVSDPLMYVPRTLEGNLKIDNEDFISAYDDPDSDEYKAFASSFSDALKSALFDKNTLQKTNHDVSVEVMRLRRGSVVVEYRVHWKPSTNTTPSEDFLSPDIFNAKLLKYLNDNNRMISIYHVAEEEIETSRLLNICNINKNDCEHSCEFDETLLDFVCTCPPGQFIHNNNPKKCLPLLEREPKFSEISEVDALNAALQNNKVHSVSTESDLDFAHFLDESAKSDMSKNYSTSELVSEPVLDDGNFSLNNLYESHNFNHDPKPEPEPTPEPDSNIPTEITELHSILEKQTHPIINNKPQNDLKLMEAKQISDPVTFSLESTTLHYDENKVRDNPQSVLTNKQELTPEAEPSPKTKLEIEVEHSQETTLSPISEPNIQMFLDQKKIQIEEGKSKSLPAANEEISSTKSDHEIILSATTGRDENIHKETLIFPHKEDKDALIEHSENRVYLSEPNIISDASYEHTTDLVTNSENKNKTKTEMLFPTINKMIDSYDSFDQKRESNKDIGENKSNDLSTWHNSASSDKNILTNDTSFIDNALNYSLSKDKINIKEESNSLTLLQTLGMKKSIDFTKQQTANEKSQSSENLENNRAFKYPSQLFNDHKFLNTDVENSFRKNEIQLNLLSNISDVTEKNFGMDNNENLSQSSSENSKELTFDDIHSLYNNTPKSFLAQYNISTESDSDLDSTDSEWLYETATETDFKDVTINTVQTTEFNKMNINNIINDGFTKDDFDPDYLNNIATNKRDEPLYGITFDYDSDDSRVKRVNSDVTESSNIIKPKKSVIDTGLTDTELVITTDATNEIAPATSTPILSTSISDKNGITNSNPSDRLHSNNITQIMNENNNDIKKNMNNDFTISENISLLGDSFATLNNPFNKDEKLNDTNIHKNLNVTIYEIPQKNTSLPLTTVKPITAHISEYEDHETEMNPFLPEIENNKNLVEKLLEGHDIELNNTNENLNESNGDQMLIIPQTSDFLSNINNRQENKIPLHLLNGTELNKMPTKQNDSTEKDNSSLNNEKYASSNESLEQGNSVEKSFYKELVPINKFLLDTEDLENSREHVAKESFLDSNINEAVTEADDYLSVVPITEKTIQDENSKLKHYNKSESITDDVVIIPNRSDANLLDSTENNKL